MRCYLDALNGRSRVLALLLSGVPAPALAQAVVPSGATATSATTAPSGKITVDIAPVTGSGLSLNTYSAFSVPTTGVDLNNRTVRANTIINEITGSSRTLMNGPLEVLGTRAHVVVVNPNGITVNGGTFINTGGIALSAGSIRYSGGNPVLNTGSGDIEVMGQGLSGTMTSLQLIAAKLKIDAPIRNLDASPGADIALIARNHDVTLDASLTAGSTSRGWANRTALGGTSGEILVDVTSRGTLSASKVSVAVSARGAGVSFAGEGQATLGGFTLTADGKVTLNGAKIVAEKAVKITATSIEVLNSSARQSEITSIANAVTLLARDGSLDLRGAVMGKMRDPDDPESRGGVTLGATGDIRLLTERADRLALAFASDDDLVVTVGGALVNNTGRLLSNARTSIEAASIDNRVDVTGGVSGGAPVIRFERGRRFWQSLWLKRKKTVHYSQDFGGLRIPNQLAYIVGKSVDIRTGSFVNSGEINAQDGTLLVVATDMVNSGASTGTYSWIKRCGLVCTLEGHSDLGSLGGSMNASAGLLLQASGSLLNDGGIIRAHGNMELDAAQIIGRGVFVPAIVTRPGGLNTFFAGDTGFMATQPSGGIFITPTGSIAIRASSPVELNGGDLIASAGINNSAGVRVIAPPTAISPVSQHRIGLLRSLF